MRVNLQNLVLTATAKPTTAPAGVPTPAPPPADEPPTPPRGNKREPSFPIDGTPPKRTRATDEDEEEDADLAGPPLLAPFPGAGLSGGAPPTTPSPAFLNLGNTCYIAVALRVLLLLPSTQHPGGFWDRIQALTSSSSGNAWAAIIATLTAQGIHRNTQEDPVWLFEQVSHLDAGLYQSLAHTVRTRRTCWDYDTPRPPTEDHYVALPVGLPPALGPQLRTLQQLLNDQWGHRFVNRV